tara:strand:- start:835 stop:1461 length:627 start_codon:yes stop_codon:yes gene_type:complete
MKTTNKLLNITLSIILIIFYSCSKDDDNTSDKVASITGKIENFAAPQTGGQGQPIGGEFSKFSFKTGKKTTDENWDIAFRGTTIAINGGEKTGTDDEPDRTGNAGATIFSGTLAGLKNIDGLVFNQDSGTSFAIPTGSDNGWYNYNFQTNLISPIPGKILVFRTHDNKYAKVEILSYYLNQDNSNPSNGRYYTFNYVYNPNDGETSLE